MHGVISVIIYLTANVCKVSVWWINCSCGWKSTSRPIPSTPCRPTRTSYHSGIIASHHFQPLCTEVFCNATQPIVSHINHIYFFQKEEEEEEEEEEETHALFFSC